MAQKPNKKLTIKKRSPITSYGIMLFYIDADKKLWYLLAQRRDSIEYADYIRGRYTLGNLETYFSLMTHDERKRLANHSFDELWDDLWINHNNRYYRDMNARAKTKFLANKKLMEKYLETTTSTVTEPGWGFPKGKKNTNESQIQCSFREFEEETRLSIDYLNLLNITPITEIFKGSNGKMYSTVYYVAQVNNKLPIKKISTKGLRTETVSEEISNLRWCTIDMAKNLLPEHRYRALVEAAGKINDYLKLCE